MDGVNGLRSKSAIFTVQVPPDPPVIVVTHAHSHAQIYKSDNRTMIAGNPSQNEMLISSGLTSAGADHHLRTSAGMTIELTCEAHGGRPPAEVSPGHAIFFSPMKVFFFHFLTFFSFFFFFFRNSLHGWIAKGTPSRVAFSTQPLNYRTVNDGIQH